MTSIETNLTGLSELVNSYCKIVISATFASKGARFNSKLNI